MDYIVSLQNYEGPLDLLLDLIRSKEMDIFDIQISDITNDYIQTIQEMKNQDMEVTADFTEMISTLLYIKTKMLLPIEKEDAREELVQQLINYEEYKQAAERLREMKEIEEKYFKRQKQEKVKKQKKGTMQDIALIYRQVLETKTKEAHKSNKLDELNKETLRYQYSIMGQINYLKSILTEEKIDVYKMFSSMNDKEEIVETFGAILELSKTRYIAIAFENDTFYIERRVEHDT